MKHSLKEGRMMNVTNQTIYGHPKYHTTPFNIPIHPNSHILYQVLDI